MPSLADTKSTRAFPARGTARHQQQAEGRGRENKATYSYNGFSLDLPPTNYSYKDKQHKETRLHDKVDGRRPDMSAASPVSGAVITVIDFHIQPSANISQPPFLGHPLWAQSTDATGIS